MKISEEQKAELYSEYFNKVVRYITSQTNNYSLAEDMASDIFLKIFEKIDSFDETKSSISTWIYTISRNHLFDYYKTRKTEVEFDETWMGEDSEDEDEELCTEENLETLSNALEALNEKEKKIIIDHYYNKISLKNIAENMGISYIYAKVLHAKALSKIGDYFKK